MLISFKHVLCMAFLVLSTMAHDIKIESIDPKDIKIESMDMKTQGAGE
jgi:hypothetical protein